MTDRDLEIGRLLATVESLRNQSADQFRRIDELEVMATKNEAGIAALKDRIDALGAPSAERRLPDALYSWRLWVTLVGASGVAFGAWSLDDLRALLLGVSP